MGTRVPVRAVAAALLAGLLTAACSGAPRPQTLETAAKDPTAVTTPGFEETTEATLPVDTTVPGVAATVPGGRPAGGGSASSTSKGVAPGGPAAVVPGSGQSTTPGVAGTDGIKPANLFSAEQDRVGITKDKVTLCGHAALIFAAAFDISPADLNVYWEDLNKGRKLNGRTVEVTYEDDQYDPAKAEAAADTCKGKNPFFLLGGIGFDQIPTVRVWAERNKMLYFHHIAVGAGSEGKKYSFTPQPTVEQVGVAFGEYLGAKYANKKVGIVYRNSDNWAPGYKAGVAEMRKRGINPVAELPVEKNGSVYSSQILALKGKADVVWLWENALAAGEFIKQAHAQEYYPTFVVFPFQTTLDLIGKEGIRSKIEGVGTWSAYRKGGYGTTPYAKFGYDAELAKFEAAMARYRPGVKPNDILWQTWLANKSIEDLLVRCGPDCTRNRLAGIFLSNFKTTVAPNCESDFTRGNPYRGGWNFITMEAYDSGPELNYRTTRWCSEHLA